jgi:hypothetical protein
MSAITTRSPSYGTSPIKRTRRTKAAIQSLRDHLRGIVEEIQPATVRQVFYQASVRGLVDKTEQSYKLICRLLVDMRRDHDLPFDWIADSTRWQRKPSTHSSLAAMLNRSQQTYRRALWDDQDAYVEIWLEKEALAGVLYGTTYDWDVPLMVTKGYPSVSFLYSAAEQIASVEKPTFIYYFGDHDPSGCDIDRFVEQELRRYAPAADITFERVAVLREQIQQLSLPTRPTKRTDSRARNFDGASVEVDAIHPEVLRGICEECITEHVDDEVLQRTQSIEEAERETLSHLVEQVA